MAASAVAIRLQLDFRAEYCRLPESPLVQRECLSASRSATSTGQAAGFKRASRRAAHEGAIQDFKVPSFEKQLAQLALTQLKKEHYREEKEITKTASVKEASSTIYRKTASAPTSADAGDAQADADDPSVLCYSENVTEKAAEPIWTAAEVQSDTEAESNRCYIAK